MRVGLSSTMRQGWCDVMTALLLVTCSKARQAVGAGLSSSIRQHEGGVDKGTRMNTSIQLLRSTYGRGSMDGKCRWVGGMDDMDIQFTIVSLPRFGLLGG